ncbi:hypothetical protein EON81_14865 [bacterium]|nr:MAG: hypothetical protein EON81_14865 [bacterium]
MLHGDGQAIFETSSTFERECSNLSPNMIDEAWRILVGPHLEGSKVVSIESPEMSSNEVQASSQVNLENPQGISWGIAMISNKTDSGAASQIVFAMLDVAGRFDRNGRVIEMTPRSQLEAFRSKRKELEAAGLKSILLRPGTCLSLDELDALLAKHVEPSLNL